MLRLLPLLEDLIFDMDQELPPTILAALRIFLPRTKLHMASLRLSNFKLGADKINDEFIDVDNMNLLSSPSLKSMFVHEFFRLDEHFDFDAAEKVALHLSPGLKHLWMHIKNERFTVRSKADLIRSSWRSPKLGKAASWHLVNTAKLSELHLVAEAVSAACLLGFSNITDFTALKNLSIRRLHKGAAPVLALLAMKGVGVFTSLEKLSLTYDCSVNYINAFISTISPLTSLALHGPTRHSTLSVLATHHKTLRHLRIHSGSEPDNALLHTSLITQLDMHVPRLQCLEIHVRRLSRNEDETRLYHAIGQCQRLRQLVLELQYDKPIPALRDILGRMAFKDALMGAAVDEELVRAIFQIISSTQSRLNPEASGLQCLKVTPRGGSENHKCGQSDVNVSQCKVQCAILHKCGRSDVNVSQCNVQCAILKSIARSWVCETSWSENMRDGVSVRPAIRLTLTLRCCDVLRRHFQLLLQLGKSCGHAMMN